MFWRSAIILVISYVIYYSYVDNPKITQEMLSTHRVRTLAYWENWQEEKLSDRVRLAPESLIDYLYKDNTFNGWPQRPVARGLDFDVRADIVRAIESIPAEIRQKVSRKTVGVFVVENLGGTAYTESVYNENGQHVAGFIVLDASVLQRRANEWATWKENTPFKKSSNFRLSARIAEASEDNREGAIRYILLHEFGHILQIGHDFDPSWGTGEKDQGSSLAQEFYQQSWAKEGEKSSLQKSSLFSSIKDIHYYAEEEKQTKASLIEKSYQFLEKTSLPTLYAATNPSDDFAESFVNYVHTVLMKKPFEIKIFEEQAEVRTYKACWQQERCQKKREILEKFLAL